MGLSVQVGEILFNFVEFPPRSCGEAFSLQVYPSRGQPRFSKCFSRRAVRALYFVYAERVPAPSQLCFGRVVFVRFPISESQSNRVYKHSRRQRDFGRWTLH